jgi:hypothetical protein
MYQKSKKQQLKKDIRGLASNLKKQQCNTQVGWCSDPLVCMLMLVLYACCHSYGPWGM